MDRFPHSKFHLEINSIEEFITFINVIRGESPAEIQSLVETLNKSTEQLDETIKENKNG